MGALIRLLDKQPVTVNMSFLWPVVKTDTLFCAMKKCWNLSVSLCNPGEAFGQLWFFVIWKNHVHSVS